MLIHTSKLRFEGGKRRDGSEEMRREEGRVLHEQSMIMMIGLAFLLNHEIDWRYNLGFATRKYRKAFCSGSYVWSQENNKRLLLVKRDGG